MLRVAIVGARRGTSLGAVFRAREDCQIIVVCDLVQQRAEEAARRLEVPRATSEFDHVLEDPAVDAVVLATPPPLHVPQSVAALQAGKHVLSEVPALWRPEEAEELVRAVRRSRAVYMMAENMAYFAWVQTFAQLVRDGFIGEPVYAECEYIHDLRGAMGAASAEQRFDDRGRTWRGAIGPAQYCTHDVGPLLQMFGDRVKTVVGMHTGAWTLRDLEVIDAEVVLCKTVAGRVIKFLASFVNARGACFHYFSIYGTEGVLESPRFDDQPYRMRTERISNLRGWVDLPVGVSHPALEGRIPSGGHGTCEWLMVEDFVAACKGEKPPAVDVFAALDWSLPGLLGHISAENGSKPLEVPDPRQWA
ncbi:MAG: Gfo/Idh/MocA family oxidoreductase [Armatimonadetes bacterium]|nr:Gfo/Idh/MocA family oxidoreductase [Armatimonadota bacterium]